tara:strand:+ start:46 stop:219 length:174 start_codon:yes stop_codon:yes gene_type:complete
LVSDGRGKVAVVRAINKPAARKSFITALIGAVPNSSGIDSKSLKVELLADRVGVIYN